MYDVENCVCFITNKASKTMADAFNEKLIQCGSTRVQWLAMYYLFKFGEMSQKELADRMDIKESTVARLLDRMEKDDYLRRDKKQHDRRITFITLTQKGDKRIKELMPVGEEMSNFFSEGISEEEIEIFNKVLNKMAQNAQRK